MKTSIDAMIDLLTKLITNSSLWDRRPGILIKNSSNESRDLLKKLTSNDLSKIRFEKGFIGWDRISIERQHEQKLKSEFDNNLKR